MLQHLTDEELLTESNTREERTDLEIELTARLAMALDAIIELTGEDPCPCGCEDANP